MADNPIYSSTQITDQIWLGTNVSSSDHNAELQKLGIHAEIDLEEARAEVPPKLPVYLWLPTKDLTPPSPLQLKIGAEVIDSVVKAGQRIYIHCTYGHSRSPVLVAAYFLYIGMSLDEALGRIKELRDKVMVEPNQVKALEEFAQTLK